MNDAFCNILGRKFYKCESNTCEFFLWAPSADVPSNQNVPSGSGTQNIRCDCGLPAVSRIVQKEGPNKGKSFYGCGKGDFNSRCKFFKWASDVDAGIGGSGFGNDSTWGNTSNWNNNGNTWTSSKKRKRPTNTKNKFGNTATKGKRKCGICGEEGKVFLFQTNNIS